MRFYWLLVGGLALGWPLAGRAQVPAAPAASASVLRAVPLPPGGLVPFRRGAVWGLADTSGHRIVAPRWPQPPDLNWAGRFLLDRPLGLSGPLLAFNAQGDSLLVPPGLALCLRPDSSLAPAPPGRPDLYYLEYRSSSYIKKVPPQLVPGEVPAPRSHPNSVSETWFDGGNGLGYNLTATAIHRRPRYRRTWKGGLLKESRDSPWALADAQGHRLTGYEYGGIGAFHDGRALVERDNFYGYLDRRGREVIPLQFGLETQFFRWQHALVSDSRDPGPAMNQGLIDTLGRFVIPLRPWQRLELPARLPPAAGPPPLLLAGTYAPNKHRAEFYTYAGQLAFPGRVFTQAEQFDLGLAWVRCQQKVGLLDTLGNFLVPCLYDELYLEQNKNPLSYTPSRDRTELLRSRRDNYEPYNPIDTLHLRAQRDGRYGYLLRATGQELIPTRYDRVQWSLQAGIAFLERAGTVYMVNLRGQELLAGERRAALRRAGQWFFQVARAGQWCVVDTAGRQRLPWQPDERELLDFQPATGLAIVRRGPPSNTERPVFTYVGPAGLVGEWLYSSLLSWGPTKLLGELAAPQSSPGSRYVALGARGQVLRHLPYSQLVRYPDTGVAGVALLLRPHDPQAGTLVLDLAAGGVRHQLPSAWADAVPCAAIGAPGAAAWGHPGRPVCASRRDTDPPQYLAAQPLEIAWPLLFITLHPAPCEGQKQELGYLGPTGRRFWVE